MAEEPPPRRARLARRDPQAGERIRRLMQRNRELKSGKWVDSTPMDGTPPRCGIHEFRTPDLRQCPHDLASVTFTGDRLDTRYPSDGGVDGYNWTIRLGEGGPTYVMKVFWDVDPPACPWTYFAQQRECQNAAILQMMQAAVSRAEPGPILVNPHPKTRRDARDNYFAFSDEVRARNADLQAKGAVAEGLVEVTEMPRVRQCYGFMTFSGEELLSRLPKNFPTPSRTVAPEDIRRIEPDCQYIAIVYENIDGIGTTWERVSLRWISYGWLASVAFRS